MKKIISYFSLFLIACMTISCEDFVDLETPNYKLDSEAVFNNDATAQSALNGIFNQLFNSNLINGGPQSVTFIGALSADNFSLTNTTQEVIEYYQNNVTPANSYNLSLWSSGYNMIYMVNSMLSGIEDNPNLSQALKNKMEGNGKFIRGLTYFYLVNLYGDVPLILNTDYKENALASRTPSEIVYNQILDDLENAEILLQEDYPDNNRARPNKYAVMALLARVHLYLGNWEEAENYSSQVIAASSYYEMLNDPNQVFLTNSREAIWQISPLGWGNSFTHTREGNLFIKNATANTPVVLSEDFLNSFQKSEDKRYMEWVATFIAAEDTLHFPYKYKIQYDASGQAPLENSMVLRLAEQYLIRAEARTKLGEFTNAIADINKIRTRAEIAGIEYQALITENELLEIILSERRRELFSEWGHRWFDLQRFGKPEILLEKENSNWATTSLLLPIPSSERMKNPNLGQNPGY